MKVGNETLSVMQDYLAEREKARKNEKAEKTEFDRNLEKILEIIESESEDSTERETYGLKSLEFMSEEEYAGFERATAEMSESEKRRHAQSIHFFSMNYVNATTQSQSTSLSMLNVQNSDMSEIMGSSFMLKVSEFSLKEGKAILSKMTGGQTSEILGFMNRFKNALLSEEKIDTKG